MTLCATFAGASVSRATRVRLLPVAEQDLVEAVSSLAAESPVAARRLADRFEDVLSRLAVNPRLGRASRDAKLSGLGYRFLVVDDYLVFYVLRPGWVLVHRIVHGARDLRNLL